MKKIHWVCAVCVWLFTWSASVLADAELLPVASFKEMEKIALQLGGESSHDTLIVMDNDDTLTMMSCRDQDSLKDCQYLGGPAWYSWQSDLVPPIKTASGRAPTKSEKKIAKHYRVAETQDELLSISALLLAMNDMPLTQKSIPHVLGNLTEKGAKLLVLTARGVSNMSATERQFSILPAFPTETGSFLSSINKHALISKESGIASIAGPITPHSCEAKRPITYQQGIMYVAGQNKGEMLKCLLARTDSKHIKNIVFIDDTLPNAEDVFAAFEQSKRYNVKALHYTYLSDHKNALIHPPSNNNYQQIARTQWLAIKNVLGEQLIKPVTKSAHK